MRIRVRIWDVGCRRQVGIIPADATRLAQRMTPQDIAVANIAKCLKLAIIDRDACVANASILLTLEKDRFRLLAQSGKKRISHSGLTVAIPASRES